MTNALVQVPNTASDAVIEHRDLVIIGTGMAATRLVETLRRRGDRRSILLLGAERALPYNRIMLSPLLGGEIDWQQLVTHSADWYEQHGIELRLGHSVSFIDRCLRRVHCAGGYSVDYGQLVFATGSRAALPPLPGIELAGVTAFREIVDVARLQQAGGSGKRAVVLGGGLLGLEAAVALAARGATVTLVHRAAQLMNRQLDGIAAQYVQKAIEARGVRVITGRAPVAVHGSADHSECGRATAVRLEDGELLPADLVVVATGIQPIAELAAAAGLPVARGIVVDNAMRTADSAVFALGECCERDGETVGLVAPIWQQVEVLTANLCGEAQQFTAQPYVTMLKVSGIDVHAMGELETDADTRALTYQDRERGIYKKLVLRGQRVVGGLLFGDIADSQLFFNLIQQQCEVTSNYCRLLLAGEWRAGEFSPQVFSERLSA
jgi:nitrite reductase (NADH) large subunit